MRGAAKVVRLAGLAVCVVGLGWGQAAFAAGRPPGFPTRPGGMKCNTGPPTPSGIPGIPPTTHGDPPYYYQLPCRIQTEQIPATLIRGRFSQSGDTGKLIFENLGCGPAPALHLSWEVSTGTPAVTHFVAAGTLPAASRIGQFVSTGVSIPAHVVPGTGLLGSTIMSRCRFLTGVWAINGVPPTPPPPAHNLSIDFSQASTPASGNGVIDVTILDRDENGLPVTGADLTIEPPVQYGAGGVPEALVCDSSNRLVSPLLLNDGSALGKTFHRSTDGAGEVHLSLYVGALAGRWLIDAYEPGKPGAPRTGQVLSVDPAGGGPVLPDALTALLIAAGNSTLANFAQSGQRNVLQWLGQIAPEIRGIDFAPIYGVDATGATNPGVVLYASDPTVRSRVLSYLDGSSSTAPNDTQAVVIDVANMQQLLLGTRLAGHLVNQIPYRLPSLTEWADGTVIQIADPDVQAFHNSTHIPIPARGRAHFGLLGATGDESLLYGYGPYPPFATTGAQQLAAFNHCVRGAFNLTSIVPHSPISVMLTAPGGRVGVDVHGQPADTLPGAVLRYGAGKTRSILVPNRPYRLSIVATGTGPATLVLTTQTASGSVTRVFTFAVHPGMRGSLAVARSGPADVLVLGTRRVRATDGLGLRIRGLPRKLASRRTDHLTVRLLDQFGQPARGVTITISGAGVRRLSAASDAHGVLHLRPHPTRAGTLVLTVAGPGYQSLRIRLAVG